MMPKGAKSEPKGSQKWSQIQVFYVKKRKKGAMKDPSVHWESISWAKVMEKRHAKNDAEICCRKKCDLNQTWRDHGSFFGGAGGLGGG